MEYKTVITHGGHSHPDDFLSICVALSTWKGILVLRRDPTKEELANPQILVVDVGGQHNPALGNFDHHMPQFKGQAVNAMTLLLKDMGLEQRFARFDWYKTMAIIDNCGPMVAAAELGCTVDALMSLQSPVTGQLLQLFSDVVEMGNEPATTEALRKIMELIGRGMLKSALDVDERIALLKTSTQVVEIAGVRGIINSVPAALKPALSFDLFLKETHGKDHGLAFSISEDDRGAGLALFRFNDHPSVDFTHVKADPQVAFAHPNGFIAKIKTRDMATAMKLVEASIKKA